MVSVERRREDDSAHIPVVEYLVLFVRDVQSVLKESYINHSQMI